MRLPAVTECLPVRLGISLLGLGWCWHRINFSESLPAALAFISSPDFLFPAIGIILLTAALKALRLRVILPGSPLSPALLEYTSLSSFFLEGFLLGPAGSRTALGALLVRGGASPEQALRAVDISRLAGSTALGAFFLAGALGGGLGSPAWAGLAVLFPLAGAATAKRPVARLTPAVFAVSLLIGGGIILPFPLVLASLGRGSALLASALGAIPLFLAVGRLPSLGGLGLREALLVALLQPRLGTGAGTIAIIFLGIWVIAVIIGGLGYLVGGYLMKKRGEDRGKA